MGAPEISIVSQLLFITFKVNSPTLLTTNLFILSGRSTKFHPKRELPSLKGRLGCIDHSASDMVYTDEQLNFFKFSTLIVDEFPKALRQTFKHMWKNFGPGSVWDDSEGVRNSFLIKERGKTKVPTDKSYEEWDCTALFHATIFARTFALPDSKGNLKTLSKLYVDPLGSMPDGRFHASVLSPTGNQAETFALAIDQLRLLRNLLSHLSSSQQINKTLFDQYTELAKDAFKALGVATDSIDDVKSLPESSFLTEEVVRLKKENRLMRFVTMLSIFSAVFLRYLKDFISLVIFLVGYFIFVVNHLSKEFNKYFTKLIKYFKKTKETNSKSNENSPFSYCPQERSLEYDTNSRKMYSSVGSPHSVQVKDPNDAVVYRQLALPSNSYFEAKKIESNENSPFSYCPQERSLVYDTNSRKMYSSVGSPHSVQVKDPNDAVVYRQLALPSNSYFKKIESNEISRLISCPLERCDTNSTTVKLCDSLDIHADVINPQLAEPSNSSLLLASQLFTNGTLNLGSKNLSLSLIP